MVKNKNDSHEHMLEGEIGGPIVAKNEAQRIAYAAVLVPGEADSDGEVVTADKVEHVAHEWMAGYRNVDIQHSLNNVGMPVESYVLPDKMEVVAYGKKTLLPKGSWILAAKLTPETWKQVEKGALTGYSVMGIRRTALDEAATKNQEASFKRTLLKDLGEDWIAAFVSVVDAPAVPKAKFFALKCQAEEKPTQSTGLFAKLAGAFAKPETAEKAGRRFSDATYTTLKTAVGELSALLQEAEAEREEKKEELKMEEAKLGEMIASAVKAAIDPLAEKVADLENAKPAEVKPGVPEELNEDFRQEVLKKLEELEKKVRKSSTASRAIPDGEPDVKKEEEAMRDIYGRRIKKEGK